MSELEQERTESISGESVGEDAAENSMAAESDTEAMPVDTSEVDQDSTQPAADTKADEDQAEAISEEARDLEPIAQDEPSSGDEDETPEAETQDVDKETSAMESVLDQEPTEEVVAAKTEELRAAVEDEIELDEVVQPVEEPEDDRLWYVVHCYSGYENKVRHNLEQRIETMDMKLKIFDVVVPTEEEIEVKDGKRRTVERRVFPGYILVQMLMDEDSWYVVRNTPGVTGFVGMGNDPTPLRPEEVSSIVKRMEAEAPRIKVTYKTGQKVRIIDGPFNDFIGTVSDIDMERAKVRVMVSFFGRETPVELDFLQVEKA